MSAGSRRARRSRCRSKWHGRSAHWATAPERSPVLLSRGSPPSLPSWKQKRPPFREAFVSVCTAVVVPLPSRPHVRPRNEDDAEQNEDGEYGAHVCSSEPVGRRHGQAIGETLCRTHHDAICESAR